MKVVRVTQNEYELEDGSVHPLVPPLEKIMTVEEFQKHYDRAIELVQGIQTAGSHNKIPKTLGPDG